MTNISGQFAIVGIGDSDVGRDLGRSAMDLKLQAITRALADSGLEKNAIDGVLTRPSRSEPQFNFSAVLAGRLGIEPRFVSDIALGGASSASMVLNAVGALAAGLCTTVLCVNGDAQTSHGNRRGRLTNWIEDFESAYGMIGAPASYGLPARRHMHEYGTTSRQFGAIAVAARKHASLNPNATFRTPITLEDHQASRFIAEPFHLLDCCPVTDGAGAVIITSAERARDMAKMPIYLLGLGQHNTHAEVQYSGSMTSPAMRLASRRAYNMAGLEPQDIDFANLYDCFTYVVLVTLEDYGFCKKGEGGPFVEGGRIEIGGELPVNTGGGLLSQAHSSGFLHITETARQLRGVCGVRQVKDAEVGIVSGQCGVTGINACLILGNHRN